MLKNYLRIAIRSLIKQKVYTIINVLGLSTGIASCILIVMFVSNEFSYDSFHARIILPTTLSFLTHMLM
jgi:putative ABC transport system permease protein